MKVATKIPWKDLKGCLFYKYRISSGSDVELLPGDNHTFEVTMENKASAVYKGLQKILQGYQTERKGPTMIVVQTHLGEY